MKKIIFLILVSGSLFADGFYSAGSFTLHSTNTMYSRKGGPDFKTSLIVGADFFGIYAEAEQNTNVEMTGYIQFMPYRAEYIIRTGYRWKMMFIQYEHLCIHGVEMLFPGGGSDRLTIGFDTRLNEKTNHTRTRRNTNN